MLITDENPAEEITAHASQILSSAFKSLRARSQPWTLNALDVHKDGNRVVVTVDLAPFGSGQFSLSVRVASLLKLKLMKVLGS